MCSTVARARKGCALLTKVIQKLSFVGDAHPAATWELLDWYHLQCSIRTRMKLAKRGNPVLVKPW